MGSNYSTMLNKEEISEITDSTGFSAAQVKRLYNRFTALDKENKGYLTKQDFIMIPELHVNPLRDRVIAVLLEDHGQEEKINFKQFAQVFATFRRGEHSHSHAQSSQLIPPNSKEKKLKFIFSVYDRDGNGTVNKTELLNILNMLVGANLPDEQMNAIAERTIAELIDESDANGNPNGVITYKKFCETLIKIDIDDKLSMKFLG